MTHSARFVDLVSSRLDDFFTERSSILTPMGSDTGVLLEYSRRFLSGGKRFRALFAYWGYRATSAPDEELIEPVICAAAALELFHAAALVHDDLIDHSETRRGGPAAHVLFRSLHREQAWSGDAESFGQSAALLLGDLLVGWSDELLDEGLSLLADRAAHRLARADFNQMRTEVTAGQYLDLLEEVAWNTVDETTLRARAERVALYKSAKYSVEAPLLMGSAIAGASTRQRSALMRFGRPLGMAFQLRDDLLGVFGDPATIGKPAGDDLIEGKRTVLIALTRERLLPGARQLMDELLGDPKLSAEQIVLLQRTITDSGASDELERLIASAVAEAIAALDEADFTPESRQELLRLAQSVAHRER